MKAAGAGFGAAGLLLSAGEDAAAAQGRPGTAKPRTEKEKLAQIASNT